jgi:hypothetical protein
MTTEAPASIKLDYPITVKELQYQIQIAIWKLGRGPHPDVSQQEIS